MTKDGYQVVRMRPDAYQRLAALVDRVAQNGWSVIGAKRVGGPTLVNVLEEAVILLEAKAAKVKR